MDFFSFLLLVALISTGGALVLFRLRSPLGRRRSLTFLGTLASVSALAWHVSRGHRPGSPAALEPVAFAAEHPTLMVVMVTGLVLMVVNERRSNAGG